MKQKRVLRNQAAYTQSTAGIHLDTQIRKAHNINHKFKIQPSG